MRHDITHPNSKYWDNEIFWYRDNGKLMKLCLGCGGKDKSITKAAVKSTGWCIPCQKKLYELGYFDQKDSDKIYDNFVTKNPFFNKFKNYK